MTGGKRVTPLNQMTAEERAIKFKLRDIFLEHDVEKFRAFVIENSPELVAQGWHEESDDKLSELMWQSKAKMIYLGAEWQRARNHLRINQFWANRPNDEELKLCKDCRWFRESPISDEAACMHLGSTPEDVICKAFELGKLD